MVDDLELYHFKEGHTARRETGLVYLIKNGGVGVEAMGKWVLRDGQNNAVDMDKYRDDMFDRYSDRLGVAVPDQDSYRFHSGWSARRETGLVTPLVHRVIGSGGGIFGLNRWVLRDENNNVVDLDIDRAILFDLYPRECRITELVSG